MGLYECVCRCLSDDVTARAGIYHARDVPPPPFFTEIDSEGTERQAGIEP